MNTPLKTGVDEGREMLPNSHFKTGCYQHNIGFRAGTMLFFQEISARVFCVSGWCAEVEECAFSGQNREDLRDMIVPTLGVEMPDRTLRVRTRSGNR